jgi:hypothetical protein
MSNTPASKNAKKPARKSAAKSKPKPKQTKQTKQAKQSTAPSSNVKYIKVMSASGGSWGCNSGNSGSMSSMNPAGNLLGYSMVMPGSGASSSCPHCGTSIAAASTIAGLPRTDVVYSGYNMVPNGSSSFRM